MFKNAGLIMLAALSCWPFAPATAQGPSFTPARSPTDFKIQTGSVPAAASPSDGPGGGAILKDRAQKGSAGARGRVDVAPGPLASTSDEQSVRDADAAFWRAFNACDAKAMTPFFASDVEFYHDITGLTRSREAVVASMMNGPCGTPGLHLRRELVASSVRYNPVPGFGAILAGQHVFYERHGGGPEKAVTRASFVVVWKQQSGHWLMSRIVSYDHQPVPYSPPSAKLALSPDILERYVGTYHTATSGDIDISLEDGVLKLHSGGLRVTLAASAIDRFFALERDLRFNFSENADSVVVAVEENGAIVATGVRPKQAQ